MDGRTAHVFDDDVAELGDLLHPAERAHTGFAGATDDAPARRLDVFRYHCGLNILRRETIGVQLVQIKHQVDLAGPAAGKVHATYAVHGFERAADLLVGDFGEFADAAAAADC